MSYKYGHLVSQCVESILSQTRVPNVINVYDDGVGDCEHVKHLYPEVNLIQRPINLGTTKNFQDALERVDTEYVLFIGADNWLRQDAIEKIMQHTEDIITYDIYLTGTEHKDFARRVSANKMEQGYPVWEQKDEMTIKQMKSRNWIHGSSAYRVSKAKGYIQMGANNTPQEDWGLFKQMIEDGATYKRIPESLLYYRRHRENFIQS